MVMKAQSPADRKRTARRRKLVGSDKVSEQNIRSIKSSVKAVVKGALVLGRDVDTEVAKEKTRQVQKRMSEYREGRVINKTERIK
jgi:hypothetical protein